MEIGGVDVFFGISPRSSYDLQRERRAIEEEDLPRFVIPIASSSGGNIVLSLAGKACGSVYWWHFEEPFSEDTAEFVAPSFDAFVNQLVVD